MGGITIFVFVRGPCDLVVRECDGSPLQAQFEFLLMLSFVTCTSPRGGGGCIGGRAPCTTTIIVPRYVGGIVVVDLKEIWHNARVVQCFVLETRCGRQITEVVHECS